jgi:hypothetical protein
VRERDKGLHRGWTEKFAKKTLEQILM